VDRTRTTIGVGEEVTITTTDGYGFSSAGDGSLSVGTANQTTLTAGQVAGTVTVTVNAHGRICTANSLTFSVVAPSGKYYVHTGGVYHTANRPDVGIKTNVYLQPDDVSFQFIQEQEGYDSTYNTPANSVWRCFTAHNPAPGWIQVGADVVGYGSYVGTDTAYSGDCEYPPPFPASQEIDNIPSYYQAGGIKEGPFANVLQEASLDGAGNLNEQKGNASGGTTVTSGSSGY
jgi:hypothetical protein